MLYVDDTPEEYEPPGFKARDGITHWQKKPFAMYVPAAAVRSVAQAAWSTIACSGDS